MAPSCVHLELPLLALLSEVLPSSLLAGKLALPAASFSAAAIQHAVKLSMTGFTALQLLQALARLAGRLVAALHEINQTFPGAAASRSL